MGDNLIKKTENMAWWSGQDILVDKNNMHVDTLYEDIRSKALIQYFSRFVTVDMSRMAEAFNTDVKELEQELRQGRIDRAQAHPRPDLGTTVVLSRTGREGDRCRHA